MTRRELIHRLSAVLIAVRTALTVSPSAVCIARRPVSSPVSVDALDAVTFDSLYGDALADHFFTDVPLFKPPQEAVRAGDNLGGEFIHNPLIYGDGANHASRQ